MSKKTSTIKLGDEAEDRLTGFRGVAIGWTRMLDNCDRITLQPAKVKDGKPAESVTFDIGRLELVKADVGAVVIALPTPDGPEVGDLVKHTNTGLKGTVTAITTWAEGCRIVSVQPKELKDGKPVGASSFDERTLTVAKRANPPAPAIKTGGPRAEPRRR